MNQRGFTLVELMIVVAIIGILAAIAYPNYSQYILKSHRTDAKSALTYASQRMERFYTERMTYNAASLGSASSDIAKTTSPDNYYTIAFDSNPTSNSPCSGTRTSNPSANAYRLCATPTGVQSSDTCGVFSLSNTGQKTPTTASCWN